MIGLVIKNAGNEYLVKTDDGKLVECKIKGNFRIKDIKTTNPVAIGDQVRFEQQPDGSAMIYEISERQNYIIRRSSNLSKQAHILAANLDTAALIVTINYPETYTTFIDRYLATAEAYRIPACLIFNKTDCYNESELEYLEAMEYLYSSMGYPTFKVSGLQPDTLQDLMKFLDGKITLFSGNSGVGKSTLINALIPGTKAKTGEISSYHKKGTHTTTFSEMYEIPTGGYIIDTPGVKGFGVLDMEKEEIGHYFRDIFPISRKCKFKNCTHTHEPGCAVIEAVDNHQIANSRYQSYLNIMEDCEGEKYR